MTISLRPMSLGELLDRSFFLYRKYFALFVGIVALPNLALLAFQLIGVAVRGGTMPTTFAATTLIWSLASMVLYLGVVAASQGATVVAVSKVHLGNTTSISEAFAGIKGRILYLALIMIGVGIGIVIGFILLIVPGIILALMWAVTIPVAVLEDKGLRDSTSRSAELTKGSRGRIFMIYFLFLVLTYIVYILWEIPIFAAIGIFARGAHPVTALPVWTQIAFPVGTFLSQCLVGPLLTIALSLVYYDQRVRKEAFDLQLMMSTLDGTQGGTTTPAAV
jgi:Membrane domain of glycerophosphoryl diester phosphodiesterase